MARCRATIRTTHADPGTIAAALLPDNTAEMDTHIEGGQVVTTVARDSPGGLRSTVDDYVVNIEVANDIADEHRPDTP
ncbi:MAG: KEOPS complex subunit Pcc1 [Haloarculaceae archaeon]